MAFDSLTLSAIVSELAPEITGAKINKIHQPDPYTILMKCHSPAGRYACSGPRTRIMAAWSAQTATEKTQPKPLCFLWFCENG